ncbi:cytochrome c3 family protein [Sorangium sp. So ce1024]|uniref:cytochrome c3 family protein n=1 Tax=Sorangium sp. So ce1024 TaxID=3133327 RepID=UPI003F02086F
MALDLSARRWKWALAGALSLAGCAAALSPGPQRSPSSLPSASSSPSAQASNLLRQDYAGSAACAPCHAEIHEAWSRSPMHRMTRRAGPQEIQAPFDGATFSFKGDKATMETHGGQRYIRLASASRGEQIFRITKVIGGRYREDYVGVEVTGVGPHDRPVGDPRAEPVMPVSWLISEKTWRYKGYSVMVPERSELRPGTSWRQTCIYCHNTAPYFASLYDDLLDRRAPYQGAVPDRLLPASRRWSLDVTDPDGLRRALEDEIAHVQGAAPRRGTPDEEPLPALIEAARKASLRHVDESDLIEIGIGCESCHNGCAEHARDPSRRPSFEVQSPLLAVREPEGRATTSATALNRACARCHSVLFSAYRYTWEGGRRNGDAGGSSINSGEARDFLLGGCANAMSCADCHDPHAEDDRGALERMGTVAGNATCVRCHAAYQGEAALQAHTHHPPDSAGSACLACHMPRKNLGLAYELTRYHRVGSPTDRARVEGDRPIECALCHADRSVASLIGDMERWWGKRYSAAALRALYGPDLQVNALEATIARGHPHEQVVAAVTLLERIGAPALPAVAGMLTHDYPLARYVVGHGMAAAAGRPLGIDLDGERDAIAAAAARWLKAAPAAQGRPSP